MPSTEPGDVAGCGQRRCHLHVGPAGGALTPAFGHPPGRGGHQRGHGHRQQQRVGRAHLHHEVAAAGARRDRLPAEGRQLGRARQRRVDRGDQPGADPDRDGQIPGDETGQPRVVPGRHGDYGPTQVGQQNAGRGTTDGEHRQQQVQLRTVRADDPGLMTPHRRHRGSALRRPHSRRRPRIPPVRTSRPRTVLRSRRVLPGGVGAGAGAQPGTYREHTRTPQERPPGRWSGGLAHRPSLTRRGRTTVRATIVGMGASNGRILAAVLAVASLLVLTSGCAGPKSRHYDPPGFRRPGSSPSPATTRRSARRSPRRTPVTWCWSVPGSTGRRSGSPPTGSRCAGRAGPA